MARPSKSIATSTGKISKQEKDVRLNKENELKGKSDMLKPPSYLTNSQKKIFKNIVKLLEQANIVGNADIYILTSCAISIDRLQNIEMQINQDINLLKDKDLISAKDKYTKDFFRCCNELSLSPQSRAKLANAVTQKAEPELLKALRDDDDEE